MSLQDLKNNLNKIRDISVEYERYMKEKDKIDLDIRNLKAKYRENKIERDVFSEYNKKLERVNNELVIIRHRIIALCRKNDDIINFEMKNVL
ncbi:hypothetical protein HYT56_01755 [Candidatus Woesearchaeota archaeon]|nr:hypothetical protein [Candidatus Woesearchaeota archaeon]